MFEGLPEFVFATLTEIKQQMRYTHGPIFKQWTDKLTVKSKLHFIAQFLA